jgi:hypothetical protein
MADQAFALSPISARATQPSEEDYEAISEAFMETARGRWFLGEYARRNRNADTRMVLDAVARIEQSLSAQKPEPSDEALAEALTAIGGAIEQARTAISAALDQFALETALAGMHKGIRVIREISWRWREIGADGRICDLIDSQINGIEAGCEQISSSDPRASLRAAFDLISRELEKFGAREPEQPIMGEATVPPFAADETLAATESGFTSARETETSTPVAAMPAGTVAASAEPGDRPEPAESIDDVAADAHDEAVLDLIALEMAAPDPADAGIYGDDIGTAEPPAEPETMAAIARAPPVTIQQPSEPDRPREPSLGSTLVASGIVRRPVSSATDPLAPIRRLSQAEKIALFS